VARTGGDRLERQDIFAAVKSFAASLKEGDIALIYFSGHGLNVGGQDYIIPSGALLAAAGREAHEYVPVSWLVEKLRDSGAGAGVIIIDACRSEPFVLTATDVLDAALKPTQPPSQSPVGNSKAITVNSLATGQSGVQAGSIKAMNAAGPQTLVAFAAQPGGTAFSTFSDEPPDRGSLFTRALALLLSQKRHPIDRLIGAAEREVEWLTGNRQQPMHESKGLGYLYFAPYQRFDDECEEVWNETVRSYSASGQQNYLTEFIGYYPASPRSPIARRRVAEVQFAPQKPFEGAPVFTGAVQSSGIRFDGGVVGTVLKSSKLRGGGSPFSGVLKSLDPGDQVLVRTNEIRGGSVKVVTADGESGFLSGIELLTNQDVKVRVDVRFSGAGTEATIVDPQALSRLSGTLSSKDSMVRIVVGRSSDAEEGRSRQVSFLRSLRMRRTLVEAGATPTRLTTVASAESLDRDTARIEVLRQ
jgi:hypothetical protein